MLCKKCGDKFGVFSKPDDEEPMKMFDTKDDAEEYIKGCSKEQKSGSRYNATDMAHMKAIHDKAVLLGAKCFSPSETKAGSRHSASDYADIQSMHDMTVRHGVKCMPPATTVKALNDGRIGGYAVLFGDVNTPDLEGEFFDTTTEFWLDAWDKRPLFYDHGRDNATKSRPIVGFIDRVVKDNVGIWIESQLEKSHQYYNAIQELVKRGVLGHSSDSIGEYIKRTYMGKSVKINQWPLVGASLTVSPMDPRQLEHPVEEIKSLGIEIPETMLPISPAKGDYTSYMEMEEKEEELKEAISESLPAEIADIKMRLAGLDYATREIDSLKQAVEKLILLFELNVLTKKEGMDNE